MGGYGVKLEILLADLPGERAQEHPDEEEKQQPRGSADGQRPVAEYIGRAEDLVFVHGHEDPPAVDGMGNQMPRLVCPLLEAKRISCPSG